MLIIQFLILQIVVFGGVIFFLKKMLHSDTQGAINRLDTVYQDLIRKQKELNEKIEAAENEYTQKKEEAAKINEQMMEETVEEVRLKKEELLKASRAEAEEIVKKANASVEELTLKLEKEVKGNVIEYAANIVRGTFDETTLKLIHERFVDDFLARSKDFDLSSVIPSIDTVMIRTAYLLDQAAKDKLSQMVTGKLGRKLNIEEAEDKETVAGIILQFGSVVLDGCLASTIGDASEAAKQKVQYEEDESTDEGQGDEAAEMKPADPQGASAEAGTPTEEGGPAAEAAEGEGPVAGEATAEEKDKGGK